MGVGWGGGRVGWGGVEMGVGVEVGWGEDGGGGGGGLGSLYSDGMSGSGCPQIGNYIVEEACEIWRPWYIISSTLRRIFLWKRLSKCTLVLGLFSKQNKTKTKQTKKVMAITFLSGLVALESRSSKSGVFLLGLYPDRGWDRIRDFQAKSG